MARWYNACSYNRDKTHICTQVLQELLAQLIECAVCHDALQHHFVVIPRRISHP
jgi:hypothetical protein